MRQDLDPMTYVTAFASHGGGGGSFGAHGDEEGGHPPAIAFHMLQDPISEQDSAPAWGKGNKTGTASLAVQQGAAVRRLTPRECERLQGFPDDWTALGPDSRRYAALGDAVTVNVAEWIGRRIMAHGAPIQAVGALRDVDAP